MVCRYSIFLPTNLKNPHSWGKWSAVTVATTSTQRNATSTAKYHYKTALTPGDVNWTCMDEMASSVVQVSQLGHIWVLLCLSQHCSCHPVFPRQQHTSHGWQGPLKKYSRPLRGWGLFGALKLSVWNINLNFRLIAIITVHTMTDIPIPSTKQRIVNTNAPRHPFLAQNNTVCHGSQVQEKQTYKYK